jgi:PhnB protein
VTSTPSPEPFATTIAPWLAVRNAQEAVDFYEAALGAVAVYRLEDGDGKLAVAELSIAGAGFWVQEDPDADPDARAAGSVRLILSVEDPDSVFEKAIAEGATMVSPVSEGYGWRTARVTDPFGHEWEISRRLTR